MKKFTTVSGTTVGQEKEVKIDEKQQKSLEFKHKVMKLMDDFLTIRAYGSARPEIMMETRIVGKEMFVVALQDLLTSEENKDVIRILESIKENSRDWKAIDDKIAELESMKRNLKLESQISSLIDKWGDDKDTLELQANKMLEKMNETKKASWLEALNKMRVTNESTKAESINLLLSVFK